MFKLLSKLLDSNEKQIKRLLPLVAEINSLEPKFQKLKDSDFPKKTEELRKKVDGDVKKLDEVLPEALALVREAINRVIGQRAFDTQLMSAIILHQGKISEQKTGEGKTLSAALAAYLNALTGKGVHIVTVNDYLARRDTGWYGRALNFAGLTLGCIIHEESFLLDLNYKHPGQEDIRLKHLKPVERREAYAADVTYGTNNEYGFDYLRDNMAQRPEDQVQRSHFFAIVDEVDSILIDEARTPLIISAPDVEPTNKYYDFAKLVKGLQKGIDYTIDEKFRTAVLTDYGIRRVERLMGVNNLYEESFDTIHHIENALRAFSLYNRDKDYIVKDDQVIIVDEFTGRLMYGRRWSDGMHQAVEAKENVKIQQESVTMATISFQNYFRMYSKLSGMTGTAATEGEEFEKIYNLEVAILPTNKPMVRTDFSDVVYKTKRAKYSAVVREIEECVKTGRPVLVGSNSIENNEIISRFLDKKGIKHRVLNAKQHEKEAGIIAQAGEKGAVTVATNMAGRGVDIILGGPAPDGKDKKEWEKWQKAHDEIVDLGGLHIVGTEHHDSRRIDNQLRGRAGRQGDPGSSKFFVSLEDDIMRIFGGDQVAKLMDFMKIPEDQPIEHPMVTKAIAQTQIRVEGANFDARKHVLQYDDVMNKQRQIIYAKRQKILEAKDEAAQEITTEIEEKLYREVETIANSSNKEDGGLDYEKIVVQFCEVLPLDVESQKRLKEELSKTDDTQKISGVLNNAVDQIYQAREKQFGEPIMRDIERFVYMNAMDRLWVDHLDAMEDLREGVGLRGNNDEERIVLYQKEGFEMFEKLMAAVDGQIVRNIFRIMPAMQKPVAPKIIMTNEDTSDGTGLTNKPTVKSKNPAAVGGKVAAKLGRNDPCWCGSGKKWKKCHYPRSG